MTERDGRVIDPPAMTAAAHDKIQRLRDHAEAVYPEDQWGLDIVLFSTGAVDARAFHSIEEVARGVVIRDISKIDDDGEITRDQYEVHVPTKYPVPEPYHREVSGGHSCVERLYDGKPTIKEEADAL